MTRVDIALCAWTRPLLALVVPHGLTDLSKPGVFGRYACWLALPLPPKATTLLFCAASCVHLGNDVGLCGSLFVHALVHEVYRLLGAQAAFNAFLVYFGTLHTPLHYLTEAANGNSPLVCACLAASAVLLCVDGKRRTFALTDAMQRLVMAHIVTVQRAACARSARSTIATSSSS